MADRPAHRPSLLWPGILVGVGLAGTLDEVVLHQLLAWHHLYDRSNLTAGLVQLVERRRTTQDPPRVALAGALLVRYTPPSRQPEWRSGSASDS